MQLNRVEAFDLLRFMPVAGLVRFSEDLCDLYYDLRERLLEGARLQAYEEEWLRRYLRNVKTSAPEQWQFVLHEVLDPLGCSDLETFLDHGFSPPSWDNLQPALTLFAPLGRAMLRHTRQLLREYQQDGHLNATLAVREVFPKIIKLQGIERAVYEALQTYCGELARHIAAVMEGNQQRAAIGFYLSFLRLRFASSFVALKCSLERRLEKIGLTLEHQANGEPAWHDTEELEQLSDEQVESLVLKNRQAIDLTWEQGEVKRLLATLEELPTVPAKTRALLEVIQQRRQTSSDRVRPLVVFTRYTDTLDRLHEELKRRLPGCPIGTFSGQGGTLRRGGQAKVENHDRTAIKRLFVSGHIDILLCTDAAAEGLNLQSADLLVNFDLPWNPMLLEQRIGRIDRIGQHHRRIKVLNFPIKEALRRRFTCAWWNVSRKPFAWPVSYSSRCCQLNRKTLPVLLKARGKRAILPKQS